MGSIKERKIGAVIGAAVADSAAQPMHWIYNYEKLDAILGDRVEIEFTTPSVNPFYCIETGKQTCYGDQAFALLESLVECKGLDNEDFTKRLYKMFGPGSEYNSEVVDKYVLKSGLNKKLPIDGPWKNASIKYFNKQVSENKKNTGCPTDQQIDCITKLPPLVAVYAGADNMLEKAEDAIRVTQDNDIAVALGLAFARLLEHYILNGPDPNAANKVMADLLDPKRKNPQDLDRHVANLIKDVLPRLENPHRQVASEVYKIS